MNVAPIANSSSRVTSLVLEHVGDHRPGGVEVQQRLERRRVRQQLVALRDRLDEQQHASPGCRAGRDPRQAGRAAHGEHDEAEDRDAEDAEQRAPDVVVDHERIQQDRRELGGEQERGRFALGEGQHARQRSPRGGRSSGCAAGAPGCETLRAHERPRPRPPHARARHAALRADRQAHPRRARRRHRDRHHPRDARLGAQARRAHLRRPGGGRRRRDPVGAGAADRRRRGARRAADGRAAARRAGRARSQRPVRRAHDRGRAAGDPRRRRGAARRRPSARPIPRSPATSSSTSTASTPGTRRTSATSPTRATRFTASTSSTARGTCASSATAWCWPSRRGPLLFEPPLPVRYYLPPEDVRATCCARARRARSAPTRAQASYLSLRGEADSPGPTPRRCARRPSHRPHRVLQRARRHGRRRRRRSGARVTPWSPR